MRWIAARIRQGAPRLALALAGATLVPEGPWQLPAALAAAVLARQLCAAAMIDAMW
jgi:hypothetical protein